MATLVLSEAMSNSTAPTTVVVAHLASQLALWYERKISESTLSMLVAVAGQLSAMVAAMEVALAAQRLRDGWMGKWMEVNEAVKASGRKQTIWANRHEASEEICLHTSCHSSCSPFRWLQNPLASFVSN